MNTRIGHPRFLELITALTIGLFSSCAGMRTPRFGDAPGELQAIVQKISTIDSDADYRIAAGLAPVVLEKPPSTPVPEAGSREAESGALVPNEKQAQQEASNSQQESGSKAPGGVTVPTVGVPREQPVKSEPPAKGVVQQAQYSADQRKEARNRLMRRLIVDIQHYHETMNNDIFTSSAYYGSVLDITVVLASALATAVTPAATKTFWAAIATIAGGSRLALSKNVLQEKSANTLLSTMIAERQSALTGILLNMAKPYNEYDIESAIIEVNTFLSTGSLDKSAAAAEAKADSEVKASRRELDAASKALNAKDPAPPTPK